MKKPFTQQAIAYVEILRLLHEKHLAIVDLVKAVGLCYATTRDYIELLKRRKFIYIMEWQVRGAHHVACYVWGEGADAAKPIMMSSKEKQRAYAQRKFANCIYDNRKMKRREIWSGGKLISFLDKVSIHAQSEPFGHYSWKTVYKGLQ